MTIERIRELDRTQNPIVHHLECFEAQVVGWENKVADLGRYYDLWVALKDLLKDEDGVSMSIGFTRSEYYGIVISFSARLISDSVPLLKQLAQAGLHQKVGKDPIEFESERSKDWYLSAGEGENELYVALSAVFQADADDETACRYVQVGEEAQPPKPTMKLVCPE